MDVFTISGANKPVKTWGPTASVKVKLSVLDGLVNDTWLLEGLYIGAKEIVDIRQCFNDVSYIYALGNDQSSCLITLNFLVFIGTRGCRGTSNLSVITDNNYRADRISQHTTPHTLGIGGFAIKGWLKEINIGQLDPERGVCHGTVGFIMQMEA